MTVKLIRYVALFVLVLSMSIACANNNNGVDPAPDNGAPGETEGPSDAELISRGEPIYGQNCARCHGGQGAGQGGTYPALTSSEAVTGDPEPVIEIIVHGQGAMPSFGGELNDEEIAALVSYIRNAWGNEASVVSPDAVADVR